MYRRFHGTRAVLRGDLSCARVERTKCSDVIVEKIVSQVSVSPRLVPVKYSVNKMYSKLLMFGATTLCLLFAVVAAQNRIPRTKFTCQGRPSGYYADVETGCQVYHMCDGLGRQFSYTCPNTTLFQQRMLICDHWYMVNCSKSESDYDANLLIGQRDKHFVSEEDMRQRTPRPDILSVPPNNNYYDGLREAETKYPIHPGNSIVGVPDSISNDKNGLDSGKNNYRPPSSWSVTNQRPNRPQTSNNQEDKITGAASQKPQPTFQSTHDKDFTQNTNVPNITPPSQDLSPPFSPSTTTEASEEMELDIRMHDREDPVYKFIRRFDPNSPDSIKTSMTKNEILNLNQHLPTGQSSAEDERTPRINKNTGNNFNQVENNNKGVTEGTRFNTVNVKPTIPTVTTDFDGSTNHVSAPDVNLLPPKRDYPELVSTTMGPPIYYEWKWAVPAFDLEPPKFNNATNNSNNDIQVRNRVQSRSPFSDVTRPTPKDIEPTPSNINTEYNISSYFVPDYVFPLDKGHVGYDNNDARTSFQVDKNRNGFGENPACPQCHPAYLKPGTCEPCIVNR